MNEWRKEYASLCTRFIAMIGPGTTDEGCRLAKIQSFASTMVEAFPNLTPPSKRRWRMVAEYRGSDLRALLLLLQATWYEDPANAPMPGGP